MTALKHNYTNDVLRTVVIKSTIPIYINTDKSIVLQSALETWTCKLQCPIVVEFQSN